MSVKLKVAILGVINFFCLFAWAQKPTLKQGIAKAILKRGLPAKVIAENKNQTVNVCNT